MMQTLEKHKIKIVFRMYSWATNQIFNSFSYCDYVKLSAQNSCSDYQSISLLPGATASVRLELGDTE